MALRGRRINNFLELWWLVASAGLGISVAGVQNPSTQKSLLRKIPLAKSLHRKIPPSKIPPQENTSQQNISGQNTYQQNTSRNKKPTNELYIQPFELFSALFLAFELLHRPMNQFPF